ncbi:MAG TPA: hypothetical protein VF057_10790 [Thermoanaerobaculia bacterium]
MPDNRVRFVRHGNVEILLIDWSNATAEEILGAIAEAKRIIASRPHNSVLTLTHVANARVDRKVTETLKEYVAHNKPYVRAGAVVGLNDLKTVIFNFVNRATGRSLRALGTLSEAQEWLAAQTK